MFKMIEKGQILSIATDKIGVGANGTLFKSGEDRILAAMEASAQAQLASCEKEFAEQGDALRAEIASLKRDVNTLNDIVRFKTDMGQGEIDSLAVDIEAIRREAEQEGIRKAVEWAESSCPHNPEGKYHSYLHGKRRDCEICWQAQKKEWGLEGK